MRDIVLSEVTVAQSIDFDMTNNWIYVGQVIEGGRQFPGEPAPVPHSQREDQGDMSITRLNLDGTFDSNMYILGAGHGTTVAVAPDGRLWTCADSSGSGFARAISLITYAPGTVNRSEDLPTFRPFGPSSQSHGLSVSVDIRFNKMCIRRTFPDPGDGRRHYLYNLDDCMAGDFSKVLRTVDQAANQPPGTPGAIGTAQGMCTYGDYLYTLEGNPEANNTYISRINWFNNVTEQKVHQVDIFNDITYREPEGITVQNFAGTPNQNKLVFGFASGGSGDRKYNLAYIPAVS